MLTEKSDNDFPWFGRLVVGDKKRMYGHVLTFAFLLLIGRFRRFNVTFPNTKSAAAKFEHIGV